MLLAARRVVFAICCDVSSFRELDRSFHRTTHDLSSGTRYVSRGTRASLSARGSTASHNSSSRFASTFDVVVEGSVPGSVARKTRGSLHIRCRLIWSSDEAVSTSTSPGVNMLRMSS